MEARKRRSCNSSAFANRNDQTEIIIADTRTITTPNGAEPSDELASPDRLEFRNTLDLLFAALRADWEYFTAPSGAPSRVKLGHAAASVWAACIQSLHTVQNTQDGHPDLQAAAARMLETIPEQAPKPTCASLHGAHILSSAKKHKKGCPRLADLLEEAFCLLEAYSANLVVMSLR